MKTVFPIHPGIIYFWIWLFGWAAYQGAEEAEAGTERALISNLCLISHRWYGVDKLTVSGSSNLSYVFQGHSKKVLCKKKMKEKCVTFYFKFNAKVSPKSFGEGWFFCAEVMFLLSKLLFTLFVSCWSSRHEIVKK